MKFTVTIELEHLSGPEQTSDTMLDYFAASTGRQNGAGASTVRLTVPIDGGPEFGGTESVYEVKLVDDR